MFKMKFFERIRINKCLKYCEGRILDIGCGTNELVKRYNRVRRHTCYGTGIDIYPWTGAIVVKDTTNLPFYDETFDRVFFVASLNHILERKKVLKEAYRVLKPDGYIIITMLSPLIGYIREITYRPWDKDYKQRGFKEGEVMGISKEDMFKLLTEAGFKDITTEKFCLGLNTLYSARK